MPIYSSSDDEITTSSTAKLFGRKRPIHSVLGGKQVADVLLWKNKKISGGLLIGVTSIWFLFEVLEYNFVTLMSHISIIAMLAIFVSGYAARFFNWNKPKIPKVLLDETTFNRMVSTIHRKFNYVLSKLLDTASGKDPALFVLAIVSLYVLSEIGTCFSFVNLLFFGFLFMQTVPFLYDNYEDDVDYLAGKLMRKLKRIYRKIDSDVLSRIPRGPVKQKKKL